MEKNCPVTWNWLQKTRTEKTERTYRSPVAGTDRLVGLSTINSTAFKSHHTYILPSITQHFKGVWSYGQQKSDVKETEFPVTVRITGSARDLEIVTFVS